VILAVAALALAATPVADAAGAPYEDVVARVETLGGFAVRDTNGTVVEVNLARTWATDNDVERVASIDTLKRLDLSFTYVTDRGIEQLKRLQHLEDLRLDTAEFLTDAAMSHLRANRNLKHLVLRGVDITDVGMPHVAELTALRSLDMSHTMLGDVGLENLPSLTELEELKLGADLVTGLNLNFLKLLPKLKKLNFNGIQRRNGGACWAPLITDLDMDTIALLSGLEELDLGIGISLSASGKPAAPGGNNCRLSGGIRITDLGLAKLSKLKNLRMLDLSGAQLTPAGLQALKQFPKLERLILWNCPTLDDSAAETLAALPSLKNLDISYTAIGDDGLQKLAALPNLKKLYATETKVTPQAAESFRRQKPNTFFSWARRPPAREIPKVENAKDPEAGAAQ
jgi:Leucine-rich repeat (LRR) protein